MWKLTLFLGLVKASPTPPTPPPTEAPEIIRYSEWQPTGRNNYCTGKVWAPFHLGANIGGTVVDVTGSQADVATALAAAAAVACTSATANVISMRMLGADNMHRHVRYGAFNNVADFLTDLADNNVINNIPSTFSGSTGTATWTFDQPCEFAADATCSFAANDLSYWQTIAPSMNYVASSSPYFGYTACYDLGNGAIGSSVGDCGHGWMHQTITWLLIDDPSSSAVQDPHLVFRNGGEADFRGIHNTYFNYISVPDLSVNVKVEESVFKLENAIVNGTFLTELHTFAIVGGAKRKTLKVSHLCSQITHQQWGWRMVNGSCGGHHFYLGPHSAKSCEEAQLSVDLSSFTIELFGWKIVSTVQPVYGRITGPKFRLDVRVKGPVTNHSHGLLGQSYDVKYTRMGGKQDVYPTVGNFTTKAQAEGAIEGIYTDYVTQNGYDPVFKFSKFS